MDARSRCLEECRPSRVVTRVGNRCRFRADRLDHRDLGLAACRLRSRVVPAYRFRSHRHHLSYHHLRCRHRFRLRRPRQEEAASRKVARSEDPVWAGRRRAFARLSEDLPRQDRPHLRARPYRWGRRPVRHRDQPGWFAARCSWALLSLRLRSHLVPERRVKMTATLRAKASRWQRTTRVAHVACTRSRPNEPRRHALV